LTIEEGEIPSLAPGLSGVLGFFTREDDGSIQVTYNGMPLYYWINDEAPGDATGHTAGDVWFVAELPTVGVGGNDELGQFLVGSDGMTLYTFDNDEEGVSNCTGGCLENWPALTVESEDALDIQPGLVGEFSTITREDDGSTQVTFNGMPLYYWINDEAIGDATGQGVGDVWFVAKAPTVSVTEDEDLGSILVGPNGMTLYTFNNDEEGASNCTEGCLANWPALTIEEGEIPSLAPGLSGVLGFFTREDDGSIQVTYNGMPLYYWINDEAPGDATGHTAGDVWFVAELPTVGVGGNDELGQFLVGSDGMTLYTFDNDEEGVSNCTGGCLENWPALTVESEDALDIQPGLVGEFSTITREDDGSTQVTFNGMPLYYWINDEAIGDATGQGVGDVWFVAKAPTVSVTEDEDLGSILVGPNGMTLYTFNNDEEGASNCTEGCLANWPALTIAEGEEIVAAEGIDGEFGTITREDTGAIQVTYNGQPLYYWVRDIAPGDTTGHTVGDVWFVAQP
jgi:predicted lipoprotein with Yx(FWY)xxD motif